MESLATLNLILVETLIEENLSWYDFIFGSCAVSWKATLQTTVALYTLSRLHGYHKSL